MVNNQNIKLSFIIPAYNEEVYLRTCLESIIAQVALEPEGEIEIIVVNNASTDRTKEIASSYPGVKVVDEPQKGLTHARQAGYLASSGELLANVDADTILPVGWLAKVFYEFSKDPKMVSLSGPYRYYDGLLFKRFIMNAIWWVTAPITYRLVGFMVLGGNFVAKREALLKMGGFDRNIEFYGEDTDIARRISKYGRAVFRMNFFIYSSTRRFQVEGLLRVNFTYAMNFIWQVIFHRPFTKTYKDIRLSSGARK